MHAERDKELRKLCVRAQLNEYIRRTAGARRLITSKQLLLCYGGKQKGKPVSKIRISQWLEEVINDCFARRSLALPLNVKGHQVRKQATSWADAAKVDP